jgi:hypothetical protein
MNAQIADYARGWNDAMLGRVPTAGASCAYWLGRTDAAAAKKS